MKTSVRSGGISGIVAGLGYLVQAIMGLVKPQTEIFSGISDYILEIVFIIALIATILALMGLHTFLGTHDPKAGTAGYWLAVVGTILMTVSAVATLFAAQNSLGIAFLAGMLLTLLGYVTLGFAALRTRALPLIGGLALVLGFPLSVFLNTLGGGILFGLAWMVVGYLLIKSQSMSVSPQISPR